MTTTHSLSHTYTLTHSHTHLLTHTLTYSHTRTNSLTHSLTHSHTHTCTLTHILTYPHTHSLPHSLPSSIPHSHTHSLTYSLVIIQIDRCSRLALTVRTAVTLSAGAPALARPVTAALPTLREINNTCERECVVVVT